MTTPIFDTTHEHSILESIHEGMHVLDANSTDLGTVDYVYLGETSSIAETGKEPATINPNVDGSDQFVGMVQRAFGKQDLPEELRERLMQNGFIHVNVPGLMSHNRFVLPDQITMVTDNGVVLRATRQELIKEE